MPALLLYQAESDSSESILLRVVRKSLAAGHRNIIVCRSQLELEEIDGRLWTASGFIAHGHAQTGLPAKLHPTWLTTSWAEARARPNQAEVLICLADFENGAGADFAISVVIVGAEQTGAQTAPLTARVREAKEQGYHVTIHRQVGRNWLTQDEPRAAKPPPPS